MYMNKFIIISNTFFMYLPYSAVVLWCKTGPWANCLYGQPHLKDLPGASIKERAKFNDP